MSRIRVLAQLLLLSCLLSLSASAQKNELSALIGRTFISNHGIKGATFYPNFLSSGNGLTLEFNYARRLRERHLYGVSIEVPIALNPDEDLNTGANLVPKQYSSIFIAPSARVNVIPKSWFSPWGSIGGGYGHFNESSTLNQDTPNPGKKGTNTGLLQMGLGFDVRFWRGLIARLAVRDYYAGLPQLNVDIGQSRQHNFFVGGGVMLRF
jgi:opacity protein-like surface antigen